MSQSTDNQISNTDLLADETLAQMKAVASDLSHERNNAEKIEVDAEPMTQGLLAESDGNSLEILVNLAKEGEIDPWDIDLEMVTDKYLQALNSAPRDNLKEAARGIFYASVLLRIKSEVLSNQIDETLNPHDDDSFEDFLDEVTDPMAQVSFRDLEVALARRSVRKQRFRPVTLNDLIAALRGAETEEEVREERRKQRQLMIDQGYYVIEPELSDDMLELTHAEDLEGAVAKARGFLLEYLIDGECINFVELYRYMGNWSNAFLASIFLSHESEVDLKQDKFYGDLWLHEPEKSN